MSDISIAKCYGALALLTWRMAPGLGMQAAELCMFFGERLV